MKHHQLAAFVAVVDRGGFHAAARSLYVTQPAITKALKDLESELGLPLLELLAFFRSERLLGV